MKTKKSVGKIRDLFCILLLVVPSMASARSLPIMLTMYEGESKVLTASNVERIAIGKADMAASTILASGEIVITADKTGETNLQFWFSDGSREQVSLVVVESNGYRELYEVKQLLKDIVGIEISAVGRRVVVDGNLQPRDIERVAMVQKRYSNILVLAQPVSDFSQKMVYFDVKVMEFNKDDVEQLGINWQTSINGPALVHTATPNSNPFFRGQNPAADFKDPLSAGVLGALQRGPLTHWGIATAISSSIDFLERNGSAMPLASPRLSARSGGKAKLNVGGQIPVITSSPAGQTVSYKDFGIILEIEPKLDPYGNLVAGVTTEVSQVDQANSVGGQPAFRTRKTNNDVSMKLGQTLVLAGLITREHQVNYAKVKWLGDIPILGALFRSKGFKGGKTELVVFITPRIMQDLASGINRTELDRADRMMGEFAKVIGEGLME